MVGQISSHKTPVARRILIAVDESAEATNAAEYGLRLAAALSAEAIFATVVNPSVTAAEITPDIYSVTADPMKEQTEARVVDTAEERLQRELLNGWQEAATARGVRSDTVLCYGDAAPELLGIAATQRADLIVCGTHGRRGIRRAMLGSVAESLARQAPCPVLVVRRTAS